MPDYRELLLAKAFEIIPGMDYNKFLYDFRDRREPPCLIYEVVIKENETWDYLKDRVYPNLVRYLKGKGLDPTSGEGFIVALFIKDWVYLIKGDDFFRVFCEMEDLNMTAFSFRVLRWLAQ